MEIFSLFITIFVFGIILSVLGLILFAILSFDIGLLLLILGVGIIFFNVLYKYMDKSDLSNQYQNVEFGKVCPNCGSDFDKTGRFCPKCGYRMYE